MLIAGEDNFEIPQGTTFHTAWLFPDEFNMDIYDGVRMQMRSQPKSDKVLWDSEDIEDSLIIDGQNLVLVIESDVTKGLTTKTCTYDVELYINPTEDYPKERVTRILYGVITLTFENTR